MTTEAQYLPSAGSISDSGQVVVAQSAAEGFVQGIVTYTVLDNLTARPVRWLAADSGITLLNTLAVRDLDDLQEKEKIAIVVLQTCDFVIIGFLTSTLLKRHLKR
jgi:hypothetical protein